MKRIFSKFIIGVAGVCVGFAICYFSMVSPLFPKQADHGVVVTISRDGNLELSGTPIVLGRLPGALKETAAKGNSVTIRVDRCANAQLVNAVLDACKSCGVTHLFARVSTAP